MNLETIITILWIILLNIAGIYIGYCYGRGTVVEVDDCVIYEETLYCEVERKLQINFG